MFSLTLIVGMIIFLDQLTKGLILSFMPLHTTHEIIPGFFNLVHVRNTGAAFSLLAGAPLFWRRTILIGLTIVVVALLVFAYTKVHHAEKWTRSAYALIVGGALGNLIDRLRLGEVVDFLDFYMGTLHWPAFNVADSAITVGGVMLFISLLRK